VGIDIELLLDFSKANILQIESRNFTVKLLEYISFALASKSVNKSTQFDSHFTELEGLE
jgi:hypothetical protein